jgi:hypothetical protein
MKINVRFSSWESECCMPVLTSQLYGTDGLTGEKIITLNCVRWTKNMVDEKWKLENKK